MQATQQVDRGSEGFISRLKGMWPVAFLGIGLWEGLLGGINVGKAISNRGDLTDLGQAPSATFLKYQVRVDYPVRARTHFLRTGIFLGVAAAGGALKGLVAPKRSRDLTSR